MKTLSYKIIMLFLFSAFASGLVAKDMKQSTLKQYDSLFSQIGEKRVGLSNPAIKSVDNPFLMEKQRVITSSETNATKPVQKPEYVLHGTFNNKAKINDSWYRLNATVGEFKLVAIESSRVVLQNKHIKKELYIRKPNAVKIQFSSK